MDMNWLESLKEPLLTRDDFRESVFKRDNYKCVFCGEKAVDAHHIMERRLFGTDCGGYFISNGASVCEKHHIMCETTEISLEQVRDACGIKKIIVPQHLYQDQPYDKWGNPILQDGRRLKGELFYDESVQKILKQGNKLDLFTDQVKYPRTMHCPWIQNIHGDDRIIKSMERFIGRRVIVTTKMDGENSSLYCDYFHARSVDGRNHPSRAWVKQFWSQICGDIPQGWRICGENLYAKHSIHYKDLSTYFMGFSIWNNLNECLSWDSTLEWFELLGIESVPILYDGVFDESKIRNLWNDKQWDTSEGYVIRIADSFSYGDFQNCVAKFVRKGHVQTAVHHWQLATIIPNELRKTNEQRSFE